MNPEIFNLVDAELKSAGFVLVRTSAEAGSRYYGVDKKSKRICVSNHHHVGNHLDTDLHDTIVIQSWSDQENILAWTKAAISTFFAKETK